jgi:chromate transporter
MIQRELVDEERWISKEEFRRALAVYQVLPGPEAHELCVYLGARARGRIGGLLAGLGFMLPGAVLMFVATWLYLRYGLGASGFQSVFGAVQAAVCALIVRAAFRIGSHMLADRWLWAIAAASGLAYASGLHFAIPLAVGGLAYASARAGQRAVASLLAALLIAGAALFAFDGRRTDPNPLGELTTVSERLEEPGLSAIAWSGLRSGLLTFGGAYTAIPFLREDATARGGWMTDREFLDGLALSGMLPAPLIIFATFVGYLGGGPLGALVMTVAIFAPAFAFTLLGHDFFERLLHREKVRVFLDGVAAAVVGLIAVTAIQLVVVALNSVAEAAVFAAALTALFRWHAKLLIPAVIGAAALVGLLLAVS